MTREETKQILDIIIRAYPRMRIVETKEDVDLWFECLEDLAYETARKATINLVKTAKDFPPDIATIRSEYDELISVEKREQGAIKTNYDYARGSYPQSIEAGYAWEEWKARAKDGEMASLFYKVIMQYVSECDKKNEDVMDFKKCVETICRDSDGKIFFKEAG